MFPDLRLSLLGAAVAAGLSGTTLAASFDCDLKSLAADEKAICDNRDLNDADVRMATELHLLAGLFAMGQRGNMMDDQADWLRKRQSCGGDLTCLRAAYDRRLQELDQIYESIDRPI